jgi:hypothetical protein
MAVYTPARPGFVVTHLTYTEGYFVWAPAVSPAIIIDVLSLDLQGRLQILEHCLQTDTATASWILSVRLAGQVTNIRTRNLTQSQASSIHLTSSDSTCLISVYMLSFRLFFDLASGRFTKRSTTKILFALLPCITLLTGQLCHSFQHFATVTIMYEET